MRERLGEINQLLRRLATFGPHHLQSPLSHPQPLEPQPMNTSMPPSSIINHDRALTSPRNRAVRSARGRAAETPSTRTHRRTAYTVFALLASVCALAGCGSSSKDRDRTVSVCHQYGATVSSCRCAVDYASAHGVPPKRMLAEITSADKAALRDPVVVRAGFMCVGR